MLTAGYSTKLVRAITKRTPPILRALDDLAISAEIVRKETRVSLSLVYQWHTGTPIAERYHAALFRILKGTLKAAIDLHAELARFGEPPAVLDELQRRIDFAAEVLAAAEESSHARR